MKGKDAVIEFEGDEIEAPDSLEGESAEAVTGHHHAHPDLGPISGTISFDADDANLDELAEAAGERQIEVCEEGEPPEEATTYDLLGVYHSPAHLLAPSIVEEADRLLEAFGGKVTFALSEVDDG